MISDELDWAHTRAEWDQSWSHARHLETMRGQYLGFFFTAVLGVTAIVGPKLDVDSERSLVVVAALALVLEILSATLYVAVRRLNSVYHWYQQIIIAIRNETLARPPAAVDLTRFDKAPTSIERGPKWAQTLATTGGTSWLVLFLGIVSLVAVLVAVAIRVATMPHPSTTAIVICLIALACGILVASTCLWILPPRFRAPQTDGPASSSEPR